MSTKQSFIKLYPDNRRTPSIFDVAGQECDSIVECPFRGVGEEGECDSDKLKAISCVVAKSVEQGERRGRISLLRVCLYGCSWYSSS